MPGNLWAGTNVSPVMTCQVINITHLKWSAGLFILLFVAACGASAPSQSPASIPGASKPLQEAVVIAQVPVAAITPTPEHSPTEILSGIRDLDVHSPDIEPATESVVLTPTLDTPSATPAIPTPTLAVIQPDIPAQAAVPDPAAVVDQPAPVPTPAPTAPALQDTQAKLDERRSVSEITPIPTADPAPIEVYAAPTDVPTSVTVEEVIDPKETSAADGGAYRFVLPSAVGGDVSLDEFLERGNVILVFYRAFW